MSGKIHIFVGPTLPPDERTSDPDWSYHPPVSQGDVYRLVDAAPKAIGIIDGYFERVPAVWHKEVLWALKQGIYVFGAASMGALRAAELYPFGMVGVGRVFEDYRDGRLVDDDEVTLVHGDASEDYRPISEAMVNVRATLAQLVQTGRLTEATCEILVDHMKSLYYPDRNYATLLEWGRGKISDVEWQALREAVFRPGSRLDQKREDARALLRHMQAFLGTEPGPLQVPWHFHHTDAWETVRRRAAAPSHT